MKPKDISAGGSSTKTITLPMKKANIYTFIKLLLVLLIITFGTISTYAIISAAAKEPITLIGLGLMGLVAASTYIKN